MGGWALGVRPIGINAGGVVPADELVGRSRELQWLLGQAAPPACGAVLLGDRRIGKTSLLRALEGPLRDAGHLVVRVSAETASLEVFGRALLDALRGTARRHIWPVDLEGEVAVNVGIGRLALKGRSQRGGRDVDVDLFTACAQAARSLGGHQRVVFLLDEITVLAAELARTSQEDAREFLRTLRKARQELPEVAMFLAGSIGLHHAMVGREVTNDLGELHVDVLAEAEARQLAQGLILGGGLAAEEPVAVAREMVTQTSGFPFYLHGTAQLLATRGGAIRPADVADTVAEALDLDLWGTSHYDSRLDGYFGPQADLVRAVLDVIATAPGPVAVDQLAESGEVAVFGAQRPALLRILARLEADHYLRRRGGADEMANGLIRRIWRHQRRL